MSIVRKANRFRGAAIVFSAIAAMVGCGSGTTMSAGERQAIADSIARQVKAAYDLSKPKGLDRGVRESDGRWYIIQEHLSDLPSMPDSAMVMAPGMTMPPKP